MITGRNCPQAELNRKKATKAALTDRESGEGGQTAGAIRREHCSTGAMGTARRGLIRRWRLVNPGKLAASWR